MRRSPDAPNKIISRPEGDAVQIYDLDDSHRYMVYAKGCPLYVEVYPPKTLYRLQ